MAYDESIDDNYADLDETPACGDRVEFDEPTPDPEPSKPHHRTMWRVAVLLIVGAVTAGWIYFGVSYADESQLTGRVVSLERRGMVFKTWCVELQPGQPGTQAVVLGIDDEDPSLLERLRQSERSGEPVTVTCRKYHGALPWRKAEVIYR